MPFLTKSSLHNNDINTQNTMLVCNVTAEAASQDDTCKLADRWKCRVDKALGESEVPNLLVFLKTKKKNTTTIRDVADCPTVCCSEIESFHNKLVKKKFGSTCSR
jgi:hypothetical protein